MRAPDRLPRMMVGCPADPALRVSVANWQDPPWNRWSFQHVREILPTALVRTNPSAAPPLTRDETRDIGSIAVGSGETLEQLLGASYTDGIAVLHDGVLIYERYFDGMRAASRHLSMSVIKSITGLLIGAMSARGLIAPERPVTDYLPELEGSGFTGATVQQLMDMTAATAYWDDGPGDDGPGSAIIGLDIASGWRPATATQGPVGILAFATQVGRGASPHGSLFRYASLNTDLVAVIAERAAGARFADLLGELIWQPIGATADAEIGLDPVGCAIASGGFSATLLDYARLGQMVLAGGAVDGRTVVPAAWIEASRRLHTVAAVTTTGVPATYANWWWRIQGRMCGLGIHGQLLAIDRATRTVVVILSSWPAPEVERYRRDQWRATDAIVAALTD